MPGRRRRHSESLPDEPEAPGLLAHHLVDRHLLLVPSTTKAEEVADLVRARVPTATDLLTAGGATLSRHSRLSGPYELSMEDAVDAAVPMPWTVCYVLDAPVERDTPPPPGLDDRDGMAFAFPAGLPWREEGRALHLLVSLARRLHGAVRAAGSLELIVPDPDRAIDLFIHSPHAIPADVMVRMVRRSVPTAVIGDPASPWPGPPELVGVQAGHMDAAGHRMTGNIPGGAPRYGTPAWPSVDPLTTTEISILHVAASQSDAMAVGGPASFDGYAVVGDVPPHGADGGVEVVVRQGSSDDPAVAGESWAFRPFTTYEVRWVTEYPEERECRSPSEAHLASRARAAAVVTKVARELVEVTPGVLTDEDGFWLDRYLL